MAKIMVSPRAGALSELLKMKGMTQVDAYERTRVDRKTLSRIDRGEKVKLEKLQQVINSLQVTEEFFRDPPTAEVADDGDDPEPGTILLRKLDAARLAELLGGAIRRIKWHLNANVVDDKAREFLIDLESVVERFQGQGANISFQETNEAEPLPLRIQLNRLKTADDVAARLERLADHRLVLLGGHHLFWEYSYEEHSAGPDIEWHSHEYRSFKTVVLSVDPLGTQSRRMRMSFGKPPPFFAPDPETAVFVNGERLLSREEL